MRVSRDAGTVAAAREAKQRSPLAKTAKKQAPAPLGGRPLAGLGGRSFVLEHTFIQPKLFFLVANDNSAPLPLA